MSKPAAIYARVSSDRQRESDTIASQTAALKAYADAHEYLVPAEWVFEDEGYSGASLVRPGLEALRDLAAAGQIEVALVYAPDRLSRKYAYQILLVEELARCGVSVVFLNSPPGNTPEDRLLEQVQGMIAEYERAQIAERTRRGKRHKARCGVVNVLSAAPYGYRYIKKSDSANAYYEVNDAEARIVRDVFEAYTQDGLSLNAIAHLLDQRHVPPPKGPRWERSTIWKLLRNPAYHGRACFGKTASRPRQRITRRLRLTGRLPVRDSATAERPRTEWLEIAVPSLITEETFALARERLQQNKHYARRRTKTPTLLQGILVCQLCGHALYRRRAQYRCLGIDGFRHANGPVCTNRPVRHNHLDALVWREIIRLLDDPTFIQAELDRRMETARHADPSRQRVDDLAREHTRVANSLDRLMTAYQQELVTLDELRERIPMLRKQQHAIALERQSRELASADQARYLRLTETLAAFRAQLRARADTLDIAERQKILRLVVKEIRVDRETITICHSLPAVKPGPEPGGPHGSPPIAAGTDLGSSKWLLGVRRVDTGLGA
jgi:site-specific DNA recombinase